MKIFKREFKTFFVFYRYYDIINNSSNFTIIFSEFYCGIHKKLNKDLFNRYLIKYSLYNFALAVYCR